MKTKNKIHGLATLLALVLGLSGITQADIYKYRDRFGRIHLTDEPMRGDVKLIKVYRGGIWRTPGQAKRRGTGLQVLRERQRRLSPLIDEIASETRVRAELLHAVVRAESAYDADAVSRAGAVGLMQLMPETAKRYGVSDRANPEQSLRGGARYLRDLLERYRFNLTLALAAYNAGESAVERYGNRVPPYRETQTYVRRVMKFFAENRRERDRRLAAN